MEIQITTDYKVPEDERIKELIKSNDIVKAACDAYLYKKLMKVLPNERKYCNLSIRRGEDSSQMNQL